MMTWSSLWCLSGSILLLLAFLAAVVFVDPLAYFGSKDLDFCGLTSVFVTLDMLPLVFLLFTNDAKVGVMFVKERKERERRNIICMEDRVRGWSSSLLLGFFSLLVLIGVLGVLGVLPAVATRFLGGATRLTHGSSPAEYSPEVKGLVQLKG